MNSPSKKLSKLRNWLLEADEAPIIEISRTKKSILSRLTALTFDEDAFVSAEAIRMTGSAAQIIAKRDPEYVRNYLLRLFWLVNDECGGICWRAPELIGEILYRCPQFDQFFPMLVSLLDMEQEDAPRFQLGILRAIGRVAQVARAELYALSALEKVRALTAWDQEPVLRETALQCMEQLSI